MSKSPLNTSMVLLEKARGGDDASLNELLGRYAARVTRWAQGRLSSRARHRLDTADVVQDVLISLVRRLPGLEIREALPVYLRRAVLNRLNDEIRRDRSGVETALPEGLDAEDPRPSPVEAAIGRDRFGLFEREFASLSPLEQTAVIARCELGFSWAEVAAELGLSSEDAARMAAKRALLHLARRMADAGRR
ncbi:MAG TPA: sigma-70 family RNA polymerase sigma factor [Thermoanaerobaculia bacterium]|nr:sigma-70 family RNA polymerase sigma factor [Thermoanaerobaculia bacterium]